METFILVLLIITIILIIITIFQNNRLKYLCNLRKEIFNTWDELDMKLLKRIQMIINLEKDFEIPKDIILKIEELKQEYLKLEDYDIQKKQDISTMVQKIISEILTKEKLEEIDSNPEKLKAKNNMIINETKIRSDVKKYNELVLKYNKKLDSIFSYIIIKIYNLQKFDFIDVPQIKMNKNS